MSKPIVYWTEPSYEGKKWVVRKYDINDKLIDEKSFGIEKAAWDFLKKINVNPK